MKKIILILLAVLIVVGIMRCDRNHYKYIKYDPELWITYDPIDLYEEPNDSAKIIEHETHVGYPFIIQGKDTTGKWGRNVVSGYFQSKTFWVKLDQMIYIGREDLDEEMEACIVKTKEATLYRHPKKDKNDVINPPLHQGDTVQVTARANGWAHIQKFRYNLTAYSSNQYGWIAESNLQDIGLLSANALDESAYQKTKQKEETRKEERKVERAKKRGVDVESEEYQKLRKTYSFYKIIYFIMGACALIVWLVFKKIASERDEQDKHRLLLFLIPLFLVCGYFADGPSWVFACAVPLMIFVVIYPLIFIKNAKPFIFIDLLASLAAGGFYLYLFSKEGVATWVLILLAVGAIFVTLAVLGYFTDDICDHCGYYADHISGSRHQVGATRRSVSHNTSESLDHTTTEKRGNTTVITNYYTTHTSTTVTEKTDYEVERTCINCGGKYKNRFTITKKL